MSEVKEIQFYDVEDVMKLTGVSKTTSYKIIRELNQELKKKGKITINGRVHKKYFDRKISVD